MDVAAAASMMPLMCHAAPDADPSTVELPSTKDCFDTVPAEGRVRPLEELVIGTLPLDGFDNVLPT